MLFFSIISWIRFALSIWAMIAPSTKTTADEKIVGELQAALDAYEKTHGTEVTLVQLDSMRFIPRWGASVPPVIPGPKP